MKKIYFWGFMLFLLIFPSQVWAANEVNVYFFHSDNCSICKQEKVYLDALKQRYPNMVIYSYETSDDNNTSLMEQAKEMYGESRSGVPFTIIGDSSYLGFSQAQKAIFQRRVYEYSLKSYENEFGNLLGISYKTDLDIEVIEYKDNSEYQIEETSGNTSTTSTSKSSNYDKYKASFILIGAGFILGIIAIIIRVLEKRGRL